MKAITAGKELLVARYFGRGDSLDAFLIAYLVPSSVIVLVMSALVSAFVPVFVETREKDGDQAAQRLLSTIMVLAVAVLAALAVLLALFAPYYLHYLGSGFSAPKLLLTRKLLYLVLPCILFGGISAFAAAVLNAGEKFALPALVPIITPVATMVLLVLVVRQWGAFSLASGVVAGNLLEAVLLLWMLRSHGLAPLFRWTGLNTRTREIFRYITPMLAASSLMGGTSVVDQAMAAMLPTGSVAALNYANKVVGAVIGVVAAAFATATLPYFSKMAAQGDWSGCRHTVKRYSLLIVITTIPLTLLLMVFARPLITLLFQRGAFSAADAAVVTSVQIAYSLQIPFFVWAMLFVRFLSSIKRNDILMYGSAISLVIDIGLNLALMRIWGIVGIALSTSIVYMVSVAFFSFWSLKLLRKAESEDDLAVQASSVPE